MQKGDEYTEIPQGSLFSLYKLIIHCPKAISKFQDSKKLPRKLQEDLIFKPGELAVAGARLVGS